VGYIGTITRQGNVPENEPMEWPAPDTAVEENESVVAPEPEKEAVPG